MTLIIFHVKTKKFTMVNYKGLSVIIAIRECIETAKLKKAEIRLETKS